MRLYKNCRIITMDDRLPNASIMVTKGGKIIYIGEEHECPVDYKQNSEIVDLKGNIVIPGFWESHLHLVDGMRSLWELNLRDCTGFEDFKSKLLKYADKLVREEWVIGHGWDESRIFGGKFPDRYLLDNICSTRPIILIRMDGHSLCANTMAIEAMKLDKLEQSSEVPYGSNNKPAGMFYEGTANMIVDKVVERLPDSYIQKLTLKAQELFVKNGITSINDICTSYGRYFDIYRKLQKEGKLKIRIVSSPNGINSKSVEEFDMRIGEETDSLKIGPSKYFLDGSFGSRTALLYEDYSDDCGNTGLQLIDKDDLKSIIMDNEVINKPVNIHAIGDKAVGTILECIEAARLDNQRDIRTRIEHVQIVKPEDIDRFSKLDITASFQPVFLYEVELTNARLGEERIKDVYRFRSFIDKGINVVFNSDWPYGGGELPSKPDKSKYIGFEPLLGIHGACCKNMNLKELVTPIQALKCYTANAAYANYREKELGKLAKGYFADFIVISKDISSVNPEEIIKTEVIMTVINGETVYAK